MQGPQQQRPRLKTDQYKDNTLIRLKPRLKQIGHTNLF